MGLDAWSWIRAVYLDPAELICDDDNGGLYRVPFSIAGDEINFDKPKEVKVKYVNAGRGGIQPEPIPLGKYVVATFNNKEDARPEKTEVQEMVIDLTAKAAEPERTIALDLAAANSHSVTINLKEKR
jgi:hypothetical protein